MTEYEIPTCGGGEITFFTESGNVADLDNDELLGYRRDLIDIVTITDYNRLERPIVLDILIEYMVVHAEITHRRYYSKKPFPKDRQPLK